MKKNISVWRLCELRERNRDSDGDDDDDDDDEDDVIDGSGDDNNGN